MNAGATLNVTKIISMAARPSRETDDWCPHCGRVVSSEKYREHISRFWNAKDSRWTSLGRDGVQRAPGTLPSSMPSGLLFVPELREASGGRFESKEEKRAIVEPPQGPGPESKGLALDGKMESLPVDDDDAEEEHALEAEEDPDEAENLDFEVEGTHQS